jgi:phage tail protein X
MVTSNTTRTIVEPLRLDILAKETMGTERGGAFEALLKANPGMAAEGPYLVAPRQVTIPETPPAPPVPTVNPWD